MKSKSLYFLSFISLVFLLCDIVSWLHYHCWPAVDLFSALLAACLIAKVIIWCLHHEKKHDNFYDQEHVEGHHHEEPHSPYDFKFPEDHHF